MSANTDSINLYKDTTGRWRWQRKASNGAIVGASTEGYVNKKDCRDNAIRNMVEVSIHE
ncbi:DUF1508 domain-containing protein [Pontibacillus yanchengensis]|uniref:DUF1508 domain-containing protein n=2 Tax=Pontibacillus yanchengensis TaxID=462910 RepID=A0ACC7VGF1_9BACI|nr:DUF1508 domain-containing protein [Pontibacillus yanchengensis]MYL33840.1 DUF1508 domain-containing protein [Pontibacillus yanchengensis]MYL53867.1 DUF1508 domain-containing protein [Pontibacillus yanchengensis]